MKGILIDATEKHIQYVVLPTEKTLFQGGLKKHLHATSVISAPTEGGSRMIFCDQDCLANPANPAFKFGAARQFLFGRVLLTGWNPVTNQPADLDGELALEKVIATVSFLSPKESREAWATEQRIAQRLYKAPR